MPLLSAHARSWALRLEGVLQQGLRVGQAAWSQRSADRLQLDAAYLRGRACHCDPGQPLHLLHSEGVREGCDVVIDYSSNVQHPQRRQLPVERLAGIAQQIGPGQSVYVKADRLPAFVQHVLPKLRGPVVLVTGDSDASVVRTHAELLESAKIAHWFAQNCDLDAEHPKLTRLPIGLDNPVYTRLDKRLGFLVGMALGKSPLDPSARRNDMGDQALLQSIAARGLPPTAARAPRARCTFHQNQKLIAPDLRAIPERQQAYLELRDNPVCEFIPRRLSQRAYWQSHGELAFEVCPRGHGLDCFRTWECLFLGTIPIVKSSPLDRLYAQEKLPVVIVESYREIDAQRLRRWQAELQQRFDASLRERLTTGYWLRRIAERARHAG